MWLEKIEIVAAVWSGIATVLATGFSLYMARQKKMGRLYFKPVQNRT